MQHLDNAKRIVIKIGTSTLTHESGQLNIRRAEHLVKVIADIKNSGRQVVIVSSGAQAVGAGRLGLMKKPDDMPGKQAVAAVGQCELMYLYDKYFSEYNHITAQILLTRDDVNVASREENLKNTFERLLQMGTIPIVNENDSVSTEEIEIGDNDTLSAIVAALVKADLLILLSDIDGLYDGDPRENAQAKLLPTVEQITPEIEAMASGSGTNRGTGGMVTKIHAAKYATEHGVDMVIMNGQNPEILYDLLDGNPMGTWFPAKPAARKERRT